MKRAVVFFLLNLPFYTAISQVDARKSIESLCGCYEVKFKYAETFSPDPDYKYRDRDDMSEGLELIVPVEISDKKIILQHLLLITDSMVIKHWREDWTYEEPILWKYDGDMRWTRSPSNTNKGKWTQSVWEVSDAPRYQGSGEWINLDGKVLWQNTSDAPLPRREYTSRNDYNVLRRTNRISLTPDGWVHEQDNQKIIRTNGADKLLVEEKGFNTYMRTNSSKCAAAKAFWDKHQDFWIKVRAGWADIMSNSSALKIKTAVDGKPLYVHLDILEKELARVSSKQSARTEEARKIAEVLQKFVEAN